MSLSSGFRSMQIKGCLLTVKGILLLQAVESWGFVMVLKGGLLSLWAVGLPVNRKAMISVSESHRDSLTSYRIMQTVKGLTNRKQLEISLMNCN